MRQLRFSYRFKIVFCTVDSAHTQLLELHVTGAICLQIGSRCKMYSIIVFDIRHYQRYCVCV